MVRWAICTFVPKSSHRDCLALNGWECEIVIIIYLNLLFEQMEKETKNALAKVLNEIYEGLKDKLLEQLDLYSMMNPTFVEACSTGIVHIANLQSELDTDDDEDLEWRLDKDDVNWILCEYNNRDTGMLQDCLDEILGMDYFDQIENVYKIINEGTPSVISDKIVYKFTHFHHFTTLDYGEDVNFGVGKLLNDEDIVNYIKSLDYKHKAMFLDMIEQKLSNYGLVIRLSHGFDYTCDDGTVVSIFMDGKRRPFGYYMCLYGYNPQYEKLMEAIVDACLEEIADGYLIHLGLKKYWGNRY